jgi:hypothetical protein
MRSGKLLILLAAWFGGTVLPAAAADWLQFRDPGGQGIASDKGLPVTWSAESNLAYSTELPGPKFKQLAHNTFEGDSSVFNASPAVNKGQLLLRSDRFLYCVGKGR